MNTRIERWASLSLVLAMAACSDDSGSADTGGATAGSAGTGATAGSAGTGATAGSAGNGGVAAAGATAGGSGGGGGTSTVETASIYGQIGRTARIPTGLDGVGDVFIAIFADNPVTNKDAEALANTRIEAADLSQDGTGVNYRVDNIPTSSAARYVVAFMDDDGNVTAESPAPAKPDLIAFDGLSPITVTLAAPGDTELNLILNAEIPF